MYGAKWLIMVQTDFWLKQSDWGRNDHGVKQLDTFHVLRGKTVGVLYEKGAEEEAFSYSPLTL